MKTISGRGICSALFFAAFAFASFTFTAASLTAQAGQAGQADGAYQSDITFSSEKIEYSGNNKFISREIENLKDRKINFKAHTGFSVPAPDAVDPLSLVKKNLTDVSTFEDIPYYSERHDSWSPLFSDIEILFQYTSPAGEEIIITEQRIPPFSSVKMRYVIQRSENFLFFKAVNLETVKYSIFPLIGEGKMFSIFGIELVGGRLECYGLGVADTGTFFLFRKRIQAAFNGRTEALISWMYHKLLNLREIQQ